MATDFKTTDSCYYINQPPSTTTTTTESSNYNNPRYHDFVTWKLKNIVNNNDTNNNNNNVDIDERFIRVNTILNSNETDIRIMNFVITTLHSLEFYRNYLMMNETCINKNEKVFYDEYTDQLKCICIDNKDCDVESNDLGLILTIAIVALVIIVIVCIVLLYTSTLLIDKINLLASITKTEI
jgi:hypothetical protein